MQAPEIELKFVVDDIPALRRAAARLGFELQTERSFESNTLYDTPDRSLRAKRQLLRLREYNGRCVLTHKRVPDASTDDARYKTRIETETELDDCAAMAEIFAQLGYTPAFRYEKYRTEWRAPVHNPPYGGWQNEPHGEAPYGHLVLDETPIGTWAELEGDPAWIDATLETLGIDPETCTTESYGMLFLHWKERHSNPAENLTFEEIQPEPLSR